MRILLTNDDGIYAPGILAMYRALMNRHDVTVVAPETVQSGGAHAITIRQPVVWHTVKVGGQFEGTTVHGTPADCVKLALNALMPEQPDLVVSGINAGLNTGIHVLYSGTVAAAIEAAVLGRPAVAVSFELYRDMDFARAAEIAAALIESIVDSGPVPGRVYNINIPKIAPGRPRGVRVAPHSIRAITDRIQERQDPAGRKYYWLDGDFHDLSGETGTDRSAVHDGHVSITPLQFNLNDGELIAQLQERDWPNVTDCSK